MEVIENMLEELQKKEYQEFIDVKDTMDDGHLDEPSKYKCDLVDEGRGI